MALGAWRVFDAPDLAAPLAAALAAFVEHGYHGTTVRQIAARAGLSVPGLYHHYPSKQALLVALTTGAVRELLARTTQAAAESGTAPRDRFDAVVEALLLFHMHRRDLAFVATTELRSLEPAARTGFVALRDAQQRMVDEIVRTGVEAGEFATEFPEEASRAVVTMCVALSTWYRPDGPLTPSQLVARYLAVARAAVAATAA